MRRRRALPRALAYAAATAGALTVAAPSVTADDGATVSVRISGLESSKGAVMSSIFKGSDGFPSSHAKAHKKAVVQISGGKATVTFKGLPPGDYAVAAFHDENGNKKLDKGMFGAPSEGWGVSNNPTARLRAPRWGEAKFTVPEGGTKNLNIKLRYPNW